MTPGRNDPCPCGSGKKYKQCCGAIAAQARTPAAAEPRQISPLSAAEPTPEEASTVLGLIQRGRGEQAATAARGLVERYPGSGLAWQLLAIGRTQSGQDALAEQVEAARLLPRDAVAQNNLGNAYGRKRRFEEAVASYRRALAIRPTFAEALANLAAALLELQRWDEALAAARKAAALDPRSARAQIHIGDALQGLGRSDQAIESLRKATELDPNLAQAHNRLGAALLAQDRPDEAADSLGRALALDPALAEAHAHLGDALRALGRVDEAVACYDRALDLGPSLAEAHVNRGNALRVLGRYDEAIADYRRAVEIRPDFAEAHSRLGAVFRRLGRIAEAQSSCQRALALNPRLDATLVILAELHADLGDFTQAEALFHQAIALAPDSAEAWAGVARVRRLTAADTEWLAQAERLVASGLPPQRELYLRYALGKYFDDVKDYDRAFVHYARANQLTRLCGVAHDRAALVNTVDRIIGAYDQAWMRRRPVPSAPPGRPVFVVGMPRSGTSLTEQILASHPDVFGAGELEYWSAAAARLEASPTTPDPADPAITAIGEGYRRLIGSLAPEARRVIDKNPINFPFLGLICAALPDARIIHMIRDPIDTCLSNYFQYFESALSYANDLEDLAHYYGQYLRLMDHWRRTLPPGMMLEVPYEALVDDQEAWSRRMVGFIGLDWDPRCLAFEKTARTVVTASNWQVRQKINKGSVERWRHYQRHLGPLLALRGQEP